MITHEIDELNDLIDAALIARRRLASLNSITGLRLSELRSLEQGCESADEAIARFHGRNALATKCEIAGKSAAQFIQQGERAGVPITFARQAEAPMRHVVRRPAPARGSLSLARARAFFTGIAGTP